MKTLYFLLSIKMEGALSRQIHVYPALQCLLNHSDYFGPQNPYEIINPDNFYLDSLIDSLPYVRDGLMLRSTINKLLRIYAKNNSLMSNDLITPDSIMKQCFGGNIPAQYYMDRIGNKTLMTTAIENGLIDHELNTFDMMTLIIPNRFTQERFNIYFIQNIITLNSDRVDVIPHVLNQLHHEHEIVSDTLNRWDELLHQKPNFNSEQKILFNDYMSKELDIKEPDI
jgi:hypothetical protein